MLKYSGTITSTVCAALDAPQDVVCSLGCQETQLPHTESTTGQYPQTLFCGPALQTLLSQFVCVLRHSVLGTESWHLELLNFIPFANRKGAKHSSHQMDKPCIESIEVKLEKPLKPSYVQCFPRKCMQKDHKQPHIPTMFPFKSK